MNTPDALKSPPMNLPPLTDEIWPPSVHDMKAGFAGRLNIYRVMAHDPALLKSWENLRNHLVLNSALTGRQRELVVLRTGFRWQAAYEWAHHVSRGREVGLSEAQIAAAAKPLTHLDPGDDQLLFAAVDALVGDGCLPQDLAARLAQLLGKAGVLDLMAIVGMYSTLAFIAKTFDVPLEPELVGLAPQW